LSAYKLQFVATIQSSYNSSGTTYLIFFGCNTYSTFDQADAVGEPNEGTAVKSVYSITSSLGLLPRYGPPYIKFVNVAALAVAGAIPTLLHLIYFRL
jgi:hypothetical protein